MELTLKQAAEQSGKSKSTIHRAIKNGKLSAQKNEDGTYAIDPSELSRVYPATITQHSNEPVRDSTDLLETKVAMLEDQLSRERETVDDLRKRLDRAEERVYALSAPPQTTEPKKGFWSRVFG